MTVKNTEQGKRIKQLAVLGLAGALAAGVGISGTFITDTQYQKSLNSKSTTNALLNDIETAQSNLRKAATEATSGNSDSAIKTINSTGGTLSEVSASTTTQAIVQGASLIVGPLGAAITVYSGGHLTIELTGLYLARRKERKEKKAANTDRRELDPSELDLVCSRREK